MSSSTPLIGEGPTKNSAKQAPLPGAEHELKSPS
jgi:hypothetical protein